MIAKTTPRTSSGLAQKFAENIAAAEALCRRGPERLARHFPKLHARLEQGLQATGVHRENAEMACRHFLCAESLAEVLAERIQDGRGKQGDRQGQIVAEYGQRVVQKLIDFPRRPARERKQIARVYPEVDLKRVHRAHQRGLVADDQIVSVLEEPVDYRSLLQRLAQTERSRHG